MVQLLEPASLWGQLANASFFLSGLFSDLLIIRMFLVAAYGFLLLNAFLGFPAWPDVIADPLLWGVDTLVWGLINLAVHGFALTRLVLDELEIKGLRPEEERLYNMLYRRSGITKLVFKRHLLSRGSFNTYVKDQVIMTNKESCGKDTIRANIPVEDLVWNASTRRLESSASETGANAPESNTIEEKLHIIIEGHVRSRVTINNITRSIDMCSGEAFDIKYLNLFGVYVGLFNSEIHAVAFSDEVTTFSIRVDDLEAMANSGPTTRQAWHAVVISLVSHIVEKHWSEHLNAPDLHPLFDPLAPDELPLPQSAGSGLFFKSPLLNTMRIMKASFFPPWRFTKLYGIRHAQTTPPLGKMASEIVKQAIAEKEMNKKAIIST